MMDLTNSQWMNPRLFLIFVRTVLQWACGRQNSRWIPRFSPLGVHTVYDPLPWVCAGPMIRSLTVGFELIKREMILGEPDLIRWVLLKKVKHQKDTLLLASKKMSTAIGPIPQNIPKLDYKGLWTSNKNGGMADTWLEPCNLLSRGPGTACPDLWPRDCEVTNWCYMKSLNSW